MRYFTRVCVILMLLLSACGQVAADTGAQARSELPRAAAPAVPAADEQSLLDGNNAFAFAFYHQVQSKSGNLVYSPYSISLAAAPTFRNWP